ncbi:MAG: P-loop NTPase [Flavonifractor plautii]
MSDCTHDCSSCGESCGERTAPQDFRAPANGLSHIGKVIAVVSGKGGVGKSTGHLLPGRSHGAAGARKVGVLDADITGPSIPTAFGSPPAGRPAATLGIYPAVDQDRHRDHEPEPAHRATRPTPWSGAARSSPDVVKQFWTDVIWGDVDCLFVDMPPGTGDVPLTVFQSLPVDGIIVVTTPQDLVSMIVTKAVKMAEMMHIPVLGLVENYSYFRCPDCGKEHAIFGESHIERVAADLGLKVLARLPIDPAVAAACDAGRIEEPDPNYLTAGPNAEVSKGHSFTKYSYPVRQGVHRME